MRGGKERRTFLTHLEGRPSSAGHANKVRFARIPPFVVGCGKLVCFPVALVKQA